jgi:hypothetical protein
MHNFVSISKVVSFTFILFLSSVKANLINISNNYLIAEGNTSKQDKSNTTTKDVLPQKEDKQKEKSKHKKHKHDHKHHKKD